MQRMRRGMVCMSVLLFSVLMLGACDLLDLLTAVDVSFYDLTANGSSGTQTTNELTLKFDESPVTLESNHIAIIGATKDSVDLSDLDSGTVKVAISGLTVANGESVAVELSNPSGFKIQPSRRSVAVYRAPASSGDGDGESDGNGDGDSDGDDDGDSDGDDDGDSEDKRW